MTSLFHVLKCFYIYKKLRLWDAKPTTIWLLMADRIINRIISLLNDVLVKVELFIFHLDFIILDYEVDFEVYIILGRLVYTTGRALVEIHKGHTKFSLNNEEATFNIIRFIKHSGVIQVTSAITYRGEILSKVQI